MNKPKFSVTKKDLEITFFSGSGAGGQHRNRHMNCVRIKHKDTGIIKTGQSSRSKESNMKEAFNSLCRDKRFLAYCQMRLVELERKETIDDRVEYMLKNELKIEEFLNGKWEVCDD